MTTRFYVGLSVGRIRSVFKSASEPTESSHGSLYVYVIGPFRTKRGAQFMADYGRNNPHCQTVGDAEKLGLKYAGRKSPYPETWH